MKIKDIRAKKPEALEKDELQLKKELMSLRAQVAMGTSPKSPKQIKSVKKALARIKTVKKEAVEANS
ncbi:MAG: 50S ribosomal protein L29 [Nanoarchaeota archaeon]